MAKKFNHSVGATAEGKMMTTIPLITSHDGKGLDKCFESAIREFEFLVPADYKHNRLEPGKTYKVKIFPILSTVSSKDCMSFLAEQHAILVGGQGLTLLQQKQKVDELPVGKWTVFFDEKDALWIDSHDCRRVPCVFRGSGGGGGFRLGHFERDWGDNCCLLCFCDL